MGLAPSCHTPAQWGRVRSVLHPSALCGALFLSSSGAEFRATLAKVQGQVSHRSVPIGHVFSTDRLVLLSSLELEGLTRSDQVSPASGFVHRAPGVGMAVPCAPRCLRVL